MCFIKFKCFIFSEQELADENDEIKVTSWLNMEYKRSHVTTFVREQQLHVTSGTLVRSRETR